MGNRGSSHRHIGRHIGGALLAASLTSGCAGMTQRYEEPAAANQIPFTVEPITPQLVSTLQRNPGQRPPIPPGTISRREYAYRIGPGDILSIFTNQSLFADRLATSVVTGDRAAESTYTVSNEGDIFLPLHGALRVSGLTVGEAYAAIERALSAFVARPQLNFRVIDFRSQRVAVAGEVEKPGFLPITDRPLTITEAVVTAGRLETADLRAVTLKRRGVDYRIDALEMLQSPDFGIDWVLEDGDVIFVPRNRNKVYLLGEAPNRTEVIDLYETSLAQLLVPEDRQGLRNTTALNYLQLGTALPGSIFVIRGSVDSARVFHLNARSPESFILADQFQVQPGDIVYVTARPVTRFNRYVAQLLPSLSTLLSTILLVDRIENLGN